ncbi:ATP-binding cassette domain-containing protein, partial [Streptomyces sp. NPDC001123]
DVHAGRTLGVVGESGSGKSATAMGIMGLLPGSASVSGRVLLGGRDLVGLDDRRLSAVRGNDIGMVFQDPLSTLTPIFSIGQHYRLTELGLSLEGPLPLLRLSAETHMPEIDRNNRAADQSSKPWIY